MPPNKSHRHHHDRSSTAPRTKERFGANAILGVSLAVAKAAAERSKHRSTGMSAVHWRAICRSPMMNIVNGGAHADNPIDVQEFMIMPVGAESIAERASWALDVFRH